MAWICLVLFVRIEAFQWVMVNPNKKSAPVSGCVPQTLHSVLPGSAPIGGITASPTIIAQVSVLSKIYRIFCEFH
jgi:hypothetical protein